MAQNWSINVRDKIWFVGAHSIFGEPKHYPGSSTPENGEIIIPISQLANLSATEIGKCVLEMLPLARACFADHLIDTYTGPQASYYERPPQEVATSMVYEDLPLLQQHIDDPHVNQERLAAAITFLQNVKNRTEHCVTNAEVHPLRSALAKTYKATFQRITARDGANCGACFSETDLTLDHVVAIARGGSGDDDNLQVLCRSCNSRKGTRTVDYRKDVSCEAQTLVQPKPAIHP